MKAHRKLRKVVSFAPRKGKREVSELLKIKYKEN
jgi:hypothetical protein